MMINEFKFSEVKKLIRSAFPDAASRRTVKVYSQATFNVRDYWDGGCRFYCVVLSVATGRPVSLLDERVFFVRQTQGNPYNAMIGKIELSPEFIVVEHSIFRGKDFGYRIYMHPSLSDAQTLVKSL